MRVSAAAALLSVIAAATSAALPRALPSASPPPALCPARTTLCRALGGLDDDEFQFEIKEFTKWKKLIIHLKGDTLKVACNAVTDPEPLSLLSTDLPTFSPQLKPIKITIETCVIQHSLLAVFKSLNITAPRSLRLDDIQRSDLAILDDILSDLRDISELEIIVLDSIAIPTTTFKALPNLKKIYLGSVLYDGNWPASLEELQLVNPEYVSGLENLQQLRILKASKNAGSFILRGALPASLESVYLSGVEAATPGLFQEAKNLQFLLWNSSPSLTEQSLPKEWLANLSELNNVTITNCNFSKLPEDLFWNSTNLQKLSITRSSLKELPENLLSHAAKVYDLNLSNNKLTTIPPSFLPSNLELLDLSHNHLSGSKREELRKALARVRALRKLSLSYNPLGDLCKTDSYADISDLESWLPTRGLCALALRGVGAAGVCYDWRHYSGLFELDLRDNNITNMPMDFRHTPDVADGRSCGAGLHVSLDGNPIQHPTYNEADYEQDMKKEEWRQDVFVEMPALRCDCELRPWLEAAQQHAPRASLIPLDDVKYKGKYGSGTVRAARCAAAAAAAGPARALQPARLWCALPACPAACRCRKRYTHQAHQIIHVNCTALADLSGVSVAGAELWVELAGLGLRAPPPLPAATRRLALPRNRISILSPHQLPDNILFVDLRENPLSLEEWSWARALLGGRPRRAALLAPLNASCDCRDLALRRTLALYKEQIEDYDKLSCRNGTRLQLAGAMCEADGGAVGGVAWYWAAAAGALLLLGAAAALALRRYRRLSTDLQLDYLADKDPAVKYDVFVSYCVEDSCTGQAAWRGLEARGWRVEAAARDWAAGGWVPALASGSVASARRTVALLSAAAARSRWSLVVADYALRRRRLLLILLPPCDDTLAQLQMRSKPIYDYAKGEACLRWDDDNLWKKMDKLLRVNGREPTTKHTTASEVETVNPYR